MGNLETDGLESTLGLAKGLQPEYKDVDQEKKICVKGNWTYFPAVFVIGKHYFT